MDVVVVGAGVFGMTAARELAQRGHGVRVLDPGPVPHPDASSTDVSKAVRLDYGADAFWTEMAAAALPIWREWNELLGEPVFRRDGFLFVTREPMQPGDFEHDSFALLTARGYELERLDRASLRARFPQWNADRFADGYFNPHDGWVDSGRAVARLAARALAEGITLLPPGRFARLVERGGQVAGVETARGTVHRADLVLVTAGAWTPLLLPWLADRLFPVGQPVLHFAVDAATFRAPHFTTWAADIAKTGWYGFPATANGALKVGNHGPGQPITADAPLAVAPADEERCRAFLRDHLPAVADAPVARRRLCLYCDSFDAAFLVDHDPDHPGLVVAAGGSGHGFKFAPLLGDLIADVVERKANPYAHRFRWRAPTERAVENCRHQ